MPKFSRPSTLSSTITLRVTPEQREDLRQRARQRDITTVELIRLAIDNLPTEPRSNGTQANSATPAVTP